MKRLVVFCLWMALFLAGGYAAASGFDRVESVPADVTAVTADNGLVYAASGNDLYVRADNQKRFRRLAAVKGEDAVIHDLLTDDGGVFIGSSAGLDYFVKGGSSPQSLFSRRFGDEGTVSVYHIGRISDDMYLSTSAGLYVRAAEGVTFEAIAGFGADTAVYWTEPLGTDVLISATSRGIYRVDRASRQVTRVFGVRESIDDEPVPANLPHTLLIRGDEVWAGTADGLLYSGDGGLSFSKMYLPAIMNIRINRLLAFEGGILAGTAEGVYRIEDTGSVTALFDIDVSDMTLASDGALYAASESGVYVCARVTASAGSLAAGDVRLPDIGAVQEAAMRYNDVHPDTIRRWRSRANYQALFPTLNLDYDKSIWGSSSSGGQCYVGPVDWSVGLSWNLGDLIFNDEQNDIDTRAKLRTQLRADILDEVNRLYFEYKRTLLEMRGIPEEDRAVKELELEQLAASLDAYTGGLFTRSLQICS